MIPITVNETSTINDSNYPAWVDLHGFDGSLTWVRYPTGFEPVFTVRHALS
jgi:hypothetical protein